LHILGTLEPPSLGHLEICHHSVPSHKTHLLRQNTIGFIFQAFHLFEDQTVLNNVLMPARIARKTVSSGTPSHALALSLLREVGLHHRMDTAAKFLSGGEKQRVCIARSLMNDPSLILADEPSGNLDAHFAKEVHNLLITTTSQRNKGLIIATHDPDLASLCSRTLTLKEGYLQ